MLRTTFALLVLAALAVCGASALHASRHWPEEGHVVPAPAGWQKKTRASLPELGSLRVRIRIGLFHSHSELIRMVADEVSEPTSESYGAYLSAERLQALVGPREGAIGRVTQWLREHGVNTWTVAPHGDWIDVLPTVDQAEALFHCPLSLWTHSSWGLSTIKTEGEYSIPAHLADDVELVVGLQHFPKPTEPLLHEPGVDNVAVTPTMLRDRYNCTLVANTTDQGLSQAVAEFQSQTINPSDLKSFFSQFVSYAHNDEITKVVGQNDPSNSGIEAALDVEYITSVGAGVPLWFYSYLSFDFWTDLTSFTANVTSESNPPMVMSISYGDQAYNNQPSKVYKDRLNTEFAKFATRGISVLFSSGDSGSGCDQSTCKHLEDNFPSACPYVTSVGATRFANGKSGDEAATKFFGSGGGFSYVFPRPSWQNTAVTHYLQTNTQLPPSSYFDATGRATPDISALGANFQIVANGRTEGVYGTSASTPTVAGLITLLNDLRIKAGKPHLGFLNPWLYSTVASTPGALFDVVLGDNGADSCCGGFSCQAGYDPVTGLGTPNFEVLKTLI